MQHNGDTARLIGQSDSDRAGCRSTRKSTTCGIVTWAGIPITMFSRTQSVVALSSPESEYYGACAVAAECLYVRSILQFWGYNPSIELQLDASSAIAIGSRQGLGKVRHMEVKYLWLQQLVATKHVRLVKVRGTEHPPDLGTKYLSRESLAKCLVMVGLRRTADIGIAAVTLVSRTARVGLAMILLRAGSTAQETTATNSPTTPHQQTVIEYQPRWGEMVSVSVGAIMVTILAMKVIAWASRQSPRQYVSKGTQTDEHSETGRNEVQEVWFTRAGRKAHTRADCPWVSYPHVTKYAICKVCQRMGR